MKPGLMNNAAVIGSTYHGVHPAFVTCISNANTTPDPTPAKRIAGVVVSAPAVTENNLETVR